MENSTLEKQFKKLSIHILASVALIVFLSSLSLVYFHIKEIEPNLLPEIHKKTGSVGHSLVKQLERALDLGIPLEEFKGMNLVFKSIMNDNKDIYSMAILSPDEKVLYQNDAPPSSDVITTKAEEDKNIDNSNFPIKFNKKDKAILKIGIDKRYVNRSINDIIYDIATILVISLLIASEIIFFFIRITLTVPIENLIRLIKGVKDRHIVFLNDKLSGDEIGGLMEKVNSYLLNCSSILDKGKKKFEKAGRRFQDSKEFFNLRKKADAISSGYVFDKNSISSHDSIDPRNIRTPIFLFIFCETLTISFLPTYGYQLYTPLWGIPKEILASSPVAVFMLAFAFFTPLTGYISDRQGVKKTFILGTLISVLGYFMCAFAETMSSLIIARAISAMGYALAFTSSQTLLASYRTANSKVDTSSIFLLAFGSATLCGAPVGGILADNIGYQSTFILSGLFSALSAAMVYKYIPEPASLAKNFATRTHFSFQKFLKLLKDPLFSSLLFLCALPARIMFGGFLFFLAPLYLLYLGNTQSTIGRVTMIYGLTLYVASPLISRLIRERFSPLLCASLGSLLIGLSAGGVMYFKNTSGVIVSITLFAIGHIMQMSSSMHIIFNYSNDKIPDVGRATVIGVYNSIERYGAVIGPILMGLFISLYSYVQAMAIVGFISLASSIMMVILYLIGRKNVLART